MSNVVMLKRAFNQAVATGAVRFTDKDTDFTVIRNFMMDYAKKFNVEISVEEIEAFIKAQQENLVDVSTKITGDGSNVKIENVSVSNTPEKLTKEDKLKEAFDDAAANAAVNFTDKVADFLVIRNAMAEYAKIHGNAFTQDEAEKYIRQQEKLWDSSITKVNISGKDIQTLKVSSLYKPEDLSDEALLKEAFAFAAANPAVTFTLEDIDFMVIKNGMEEFIKDHGRTISSEMIAAHIRSSFNKMNEAVKDFSFEAKIGR